MNKFQLALHIFRRDLRIVDNTALIQAMRLSERVIPCFILDDRQLKDNDFKSGKGLQFMAESLYDLNREIEHRQGRLFLFYGIPEKIVEKLIQHARIDAVFINRDYTPFSRERDLQIRMVCEKHGISFQVFNDILLNEPEAVLKTDNQPYTVFTPFMRRSAMIPVRRPETIQRYSFLSKKIAFEFPITHLHKIIEVQDKRLFLQGGRDKALTLLAGIPRLKDYDRNRNFPSVRGTSFLSPHLKFGTVSIREVYAAIITHLGTNHTLVKQLYWRDFFTHIAFHFPDVFGNAFRKKFDLIEWGNDPDKFDAWCKGETGFPIVDAGMRQMNETGWMHNRVRMIVASFLVKDLHVDWRWGEKYFAQRLIDYDPAVNNGNWQWAASTGCDAQPYFRIFNPWLQQKKFDPDCRYIKTWIPELAEKTPAEIHSMHNSFTGNIHYPKPIVEHAKVSREIIIMFRSIINE